MKLAAAVIVFMICFIGCTKNEFDFPLDDQLYESRYPLEIKSLDAYIAPVLNANKQHIAVSWIMDIDYMREFYPGYTLSMTTRFYNGDENHLADITTAEGSLEMRANWGSVYFTAVHEGTVIFEFYHPYD